MIELPFFIGKKTKWISGINEFTTCKDIVVSILHTEGILQPQTDRKTGPSDRNAGPADRKESDPSDTKAKDDICTEENAHRNYALVEKWREVEKVLKPSTLVLKIWSAWGEERDNVTFSVKRIRHRNQEPIVGGTKVRRRTSRAGGSRGHRTPDTIHPRGIVRSQRNLQNEIEDILKTIINQGESVKQHLVSLQGGEVEDHIDQLLGEIKSLSETKLREAKPKIQENPETSNDSGVGGEGDEGAGGEVDERVEGGPAPLPSRVETPEIYSLDLSLIDSDLPKSQIEENTTSPMPIKPPPKPLSDHNPPPKPRMLPKLPVQTRALERGAVGPQPQQPHIPLVGSLAPQPHTTLVGSLAPQPHNPFLGPLPPSNNQDAYYFPANAGSSPKLQSGQINPLPATILGNKDSDFHKSLNQSRIEISGKQSGPGQGAEEGEAETMPTSVHSEPTGESSASPDGEGAAPVLLPPPNDPSFYEWMDMFEKLHRLNRLLETKEEQVLALSYEYTSFKEEDEPRGDYPEPRGGYRTPPPCFNTDVVRFREINARLMNDISNNGSVLSRLNLSKENKQRLVSQLEFDVNMVERESRRLQTDLNKVQAMQTNMPPVLSSLPSRPLNASSSLPSKPALETLNRLKEQSPIESNSIPVRSKENSIENVSFDNSIESADAFQTKPKTAILDNRQHVATNSLPRDTTKERKSVRFSDSETDTSTATVMAYGTNRRPKSILKETDGGDCSSDTGLSSLSVSSEEGTYSLTTLV